MNMDFMLDQWVQILHCETYWKGLLSQDFQENATYQEACVIGRELREKGSHLVNLKKKNDVAVLVSNEALTALKWFGIEATAADHGKTIYCSRSHHRNPLS